MDINMDISKLTEDQAKWELKEIIEWLDRLDEEDYFGTEGWEKLYND